MYEEKVSLCFIPKGWFPVRYVCHRKSMVCVSPGNPALDNILRGFPAPQLHISVQAWIGSGFEDETRWPTNGCCNNVTLSPYWYSAAKCHLR